MNIFEIFEEKVRSRPDDVMIYEKNKEFTFKEVYNLVCYFSSRIEEVTNSNKKRILLNIDHNYKVIIAILAVLKTGNVYVPISKQSSEMHKRKIADYCQTDIIMTDVKLSSEWQEILIPDKVENVSYEIIDIGLHHKYQDDEEVYILFTSGSTGQPKGCSVNYGNLKYILRNMIIISECDSKSKYCFTTPYTFDVSVTEIYCFIYGASLYICDLSNLDDFNHFPNAICTEKITHLAISPSGLKNIYRTFSEQSLNDMGKVLECVMVAGEIFKKDIFELWKKNNWKYRLWNLYGPTEATVYATGHQLSKENKYINSVPIGIPLNGVNYFIDKKNEQGVGELVLGGEGITSGYINNDSENTKRFFIKDGIRYYRTGDLVSEDNNMLIYHGRNDDQIQINGIRVELGEIENRILEVDEVSEVVVLYCQNKIIATLISNLGERDLKIKLLEKLPRYMFPNIIRYVKSFKLNSNNKIDRKKVLNDYYLSTKNIVNYKDRSISNDLALKILKIMQESLDEGEAISTIYDDFFESGANSLNTFFLSVKLEEDYCMNLPIDAFYSLRTPEKIANYLLDSQRNKVGGSDANLELKKISSLTSCVNKYLYTEEVEVINTYKALYLQSYYYHNKLNSAVTLKYDIEGNLSLLEVRNAIYTLVKNNSILLSKLYLDSNILYFKEYRLIDNVEIPFIELEQENENIIDFISENYLSDIFYSRYNDGLLSLFIIVKHGARHTIVGFLDHSIADAASVSLIKNKLGKLLSGLKCENQLSYKDYCMKIHDRNKNIDEALNHWYINQLKLCKVDNRDKIFNENMETDYFTIDIEKIKFSSNFDIVKYLSYFVGEKLDKVLNQEQISLRTIVNIRDYKDNYPFKETIGDLHCSTTLFWKRGNTQVQFFEKADEVFSLFADNLFRHSSYLANSINVDKVKKDHLTEITDNADLVSINFAGTIHEKEIDHYKKKIPELQKKLFEINKRIFVTAYLSDKKLHIFLNKKI